VKLESERMARLVLREPQVASEKEVVANERRYRVEDDVEGAANELLYKLAFQKHAYHWPTIGWMDDIKNFTPDDCAAFYKTYYAPNNATLVVVGDVKLKDALVKIREGYGKLPPATLPVEDTTPEPFQLEERRIEVKKPTASEKVILGYRGPALGDNDHPALVVLSEILFGGRASRLYEKLVIEKELVTDLRGWASTFRDPGLFEMFFYARGEHTCEAILTALEPEIARLHVDVVSEEELARAKARLELGLLSTLDTASGKAEQMGFYDTVLGDPIGAFARLAAYRRVTAGDIRTAARRYLNAAQRTMVIVRRDGSPSATADESAEAAQ
jgi:zinc protease